MSCPCDLFLFPPRLFIAAGLTQLKRQIAEFPEFRRALLHDIGAVTTLHDWRGRQPDDFGIMLLEMWAYVCDVTAFYDGVLAHENYVRTARRRVSVQQLTALLGYRPRPAVGASVELAAFADGRQLVSVPAGTAFRSEAFPGSAPQVFELDQDTDIHPFFNEWKLQPIRPSTFGSAAVSRNYLLCTRGTVTVKKDDLVLVRIGTAKYPRLVTAVSDYDGVDGARYTKVELDSNLSIPANTAVASVQLVKPTVTAGLWPLTHDGGAFSLNTAVVIVYGPPPPPVSPYAYLDSVNRGARAGQDVVFSTDGHLAVRHINGTAQAERTISPATNVTVKDAGGNNISVPIPASKTTTTKLLLDAHLDTLLGYYSGGGVIGGPFATASPTDIAVHLGFIAAGTVTVEALTTLQPSDSLTVPLPIEQPQDADPPGQFQLEDKNGFGAAIDGTLSYASGVLQLGQDAGWDPPLTVPVRLFGNVLKATRGETVANEVLGFGDATQASQTFPLKKSPLTYLPSPTQDNDLGVASTLQVYVDGVQWSEAPSFFRRDEPGAGLHRPGK